MPVLKFLAVESCQSRAESALIYSGKVPNLRVQTRNCEMRKMMSLNCSICLMPIFGVGKVIEFGLQRRSSPSTWMFVLSFLFFWFHGFWRTFEAGCVPSIMSQPKSRIATRSNAWIRRARFQSCLLIEIENSLEMALSKAKSGSTWQSHFLVVWNLATCSKYEALYIAQVNQSL